MFNNFMVLEVLYTTWTIKYIIEGAHDNGRVISSLDNLIFSFGIC